MFATYDNPLPPAEPATKIIATVDRNGRVFAVSLDNEEVPSFGLEDFTLHELPLGTDVQPGQMIDTVRPA